MKHPSSTTTVGTRAPVRGAIVLPVVAFAIPFFVSGPQWLTGTAVNCLLILAAARLPRRFVWSVILLPSVGAVLHGALFGPFTRFLLIFIPFIWIGNGIFVASFLRLRSSSVLLAVCAGALAKAVFLALFALTFFRFGLVPSIFVTSMSVIQFATAVAGGILALMILRFLKTPHE
ncbi:MAG: hypothetical protein ABIG34_04790 [Candidatus Peregrinibacteria bacterium]